jgi:release factor glutamine methyltransferase
LSKKALDVARRNADTLGCSDKIEFRKSDLFENVYEGERFDLILSNPPYITEEDYKTLPPEVRADPKLALTSGARGLDAIDVILAEAPSYLKTGGRIMFEIGYNQAEIVQEMTARDDRYDSIVTMKDLNNIDRVVILGCD